MFKTFVIIITGQVQGVGFRPFVYTLAKTKNLVGTVSNNEKGVIIYLAGNEEEIQSFYQELIHHPPPVSIIKESNIRKISFHEFDDFKIISSVKKGKLNLPLTPDFAICDDCKKDIINPNNRRYNYPFTTCVNCGPRWGITTTFPFEREHTSVDDFPMCEDCEAEYKNPSDRRFHSQTNTCKTCGVEIFLTNNKGEKLNISKNNIFLKTVEYLKKGKIIAIKNTSGYLLCCDANNRSAIQQLRLKKARPKKPFAVLYPNIDLLEKHLSINEKQKKAFQSTQRPIVIISKTDFKGKLAFAEVAPNLNQLGIMLPYSGILQLLANELNIPIVATSGNLHGSPILSENKESFEGLKNIADYFLHHNLEIVNPQDDSVIKYSTKFNHEVLFRRSRGYAPNFFTEKLSSENKIMAMGSHLKNTIAFLPNDYLYISQYLGNLDNFQVYERFVQMATKFIELFEQDPDVILIDKHPIYQSTQYGKELSKKLNIKLYKIQHHKAHFASVLGEHNLFKNDDSVLGVIWDGTGYGDDGQIWGGEFFIYQDTKMERASHFEYFDWLAGDKMAKEPKLSLLSLAEEELHSVLTEKFSEKEIVIYQSLKQKNKLKTSSVGRFFDAVASLLNICDINSYEGEAAILMENLVLDYELDNCKSYCTTFYSETIPTKLLLKNIFVDFKNGASKEQIIINFLYTLASIILQVAEQKSIKKIALSGGVFQNTVLIDMLKEMSKNKYKLYFNRNLAPNDENISHGQIMYFLNNING